MELYKKHRPATLEEIYGQGAAVAMIESWIEGKKIPHAILCTGPSGTGKTTIARILCEFVGCHKDDYHESNCADQRGIDDVRAINQMIRKKPFKKSIVVCLDECHQLPTASQNLLLKMLEDTPRWVYFILATTDPQKIIKTVKTRCSSIALQSVPPAELEKLLVATCKKEDLKIDEEVLEKIVNVADGSARQGMVLLSDVAGVKGKADQLAIIAKKDAQAETKEICQMLINGAQWPAAAKVLKAMDLADPEPARRAVLGYAAACLLNGSKRAAMVIDYFSDHMYESGRAGFIFACHAVIAGK